MKKSLDRQTIIEMFQNGKPYGAMGPAFPDYEFLYEYVKDVQPSMIIEVGTHFGYSAFAMASAMIDSNNPGVICTIDIKCYEHTLDNIRKFSNIYFILGDSKDVLPTLPSSNLAYIDGGHSYEQVKFDFDMLVPETELIILHDIISVHGPRKLLKEIIASNNYKYVFTDHHDLNFNNEELIPLEMARKCYYDDNKLIGVGTAFIGGSFS